MLETVSTLVTMPPNISSPGKLFQLLPWHPMSALLVNYFTTVSMAPNVCSPGKLFHNCFHGTQCLLSW